MVYARATGLILFAATLLMTHTAFADAAKFPVKGLVKSGSGSGVGTTAVLVVDNTAAPSTAAASGKVLVLMQACFKVDAGAVVTLSAGTTSVAFAASNSNGGTGCQN